MTWGALLREGQLKLLSAFDDEPAETVCQEARLLLSWVSGRSTAWLLAHLEDRADIPGDMDGRIIADRFIDAVSRREQREPVAYVTGQAGFHGQVFDVNPNVLIPRPDTELLVDVVSEFMNGLEGISERRAMPAVDANGLSVNDLDRSWSPDAYFPRVLEIGTGSGCISCILAQNHGKMLVEAIDLSAEALAVAQRNAVRLGVSDRIRFRRADVLSEDLAQAFSNPHPDNQTFPLMQSDSLKSGSQYDAIVSNPPYIPTEDLAGLMPDVLRFEPRIALDGGPDGLVFYRRLLLISKDLLKPGGLLAVEIGYDQGITVPDLFREAGFVPAVHYDFGGNPRVVTGLFSPEHIEREP